MSLVGVIQVGRVAVYTWLFVVDLLTEAGWCKEAGFDD